MWSFLDLEHGLNIKSIIKLYIFSSVIKISKIIKLFELYELYFFYKTVKKKRNLLNWTTNFKLNDLFASIYNTYICTFWIDIVFMNNEVHNVSIVKNLRQVGNTIIIIYSGEYQICHCRFQIKVVGWNLLIKVYFINCYCIIYILLCIVIYVTIIVKNLIFQHKNNYNPLCMNQQKYLFIIRNNIYSLKQYLIWKMSYWK